jgi:hypothetical protein
MVAPRLIVILRENHEEIVKRWLDNCREHIADEFEQMLETPMGRGVADSMYKLALDYLEAEDYETSAILHRAHASASNASFRRAAVGFNLPDIVTAATAFRNAMQETLLNRFHPANDADEKSLLESFIRLTRLTDALIAGRIAGYFTYSKFGDDSEEVAKAM